MSITFSSHPPEMATFYGIEAGRGYLYSELVANSGGAAGRHNGLMADVLCYTGAVIQVSKKGKEAMKAGVMARAAFQQTFDIFVRATAAGEVDKLQSTVSRTAIGDFERNDAVKAKRLDTAPESAVDSTMSLLLNASSQLGKSRRRRYKRGKSLVQPSDSVLADVSAKKYDPPPGTL